VKQYVQNYPNVLQNNIPYYRCYG